MRSHFPEYFRPGADDFKQIWESAIIILDTNVLLDLYRFSPQTRDKFIEILSKVTDRLWIPNQVAFEFLRRRPDVILTSIVVYEKILRFLEDLTSTHIRNELSKIFNMKFHPFINKDDLLDRISVAINENKEILQKQKEEYPDLLKSDDILDIVIKFFENKTGEPYTSDQLDSIYKNGKERYEKRIPPGFSDSEGNNKKAGNEIYGDLVIWLQILDKAAESNKPIIFITNDEKEDWWWIIKGKTISPRPELLKEFKVKSNSLFYMYKTENFMKYATEFLQVAIEQESIEEVKNIREHASRSFSLKDIDRLHTYTTLETLGLSQEEIRRLSQPLKDAINDANLINSANFIRSMAESSSFTQIKNLLETDRAFIDKLGRPLTTLGAYRLMKSLDEVSTEENEPDETYDSLGEDQGNSDS